jgi:uncharacterized protein YciI
MDTIFGKKSLYAPESEIKFAQKTQKFIESGVENYFVKQKLTGDSAIDVFGWSVATNSNGTVLMMGGHYDDDSGFNAGAALIYTGNAVAGWQLRQKLTGDSANDEFGQSVAINSDGTLLMMGGALDDDGGNNAGAALIYTGSAQGGWTLKQKLTGDSADDSFGSSIATNSNGTVLMIGAFYDDDSGFNAGAALVYTGSAQGGWTLKQKITGDSTNDYFGWSVATNSDGTVLMMGGDLDDDGGIDAGATLIYTGSAQNGWALKQKLTGDSAGDQFGWNVATNSDGTVLMIGAFYDDDGGENAGAALVYTNKVLSPAPQIEIKFLKPQLILGIGYDDPNNALEPDVTAWVLMDGPLYNTESDENSGFIGGQSWRKMAPIGYLPYGKETYSYGDEQVRWNGAFWAYTNDLVGRTFAISYDDVQWPWLATWTNNFVGAKITSTYVKTTNYPAVP